MVVVAEEPAVECGGARRGTTITLLDLDRFVGKRSDPWRPYGRADGAVFDTCDIAPGDDVCQNIGDASFAINNATTLDYGVRCDATSVCITGASLHDACASLYSVQVTLNDPSAPTMTAPAGPLWSATYTRGRQETSSWGGRDNSGISEAAWFVDGRQQTRDTSACDYSQPVPCPNTPAETPHPVGLNAFGEGQHQLQAVIKDAAGNTTTAGPKTITIDRAAPGPPGGLTVVGGDASRATNSFDVTWRNPEGQVAPISRAHYRICSAFGRSCTPEATSGGENNATLTGLQVPGQGAWTVTVWLEDAAGNLSSSTASVLLHYLDGAGGGPKASAAIALAKAKLDRRHRLVVRGTAATDLAHRLTIRYRYRPHKHSKLRATTRKGTVRHDTFAAHLKLSHAARRARKGTLTVTYAGDTAHDPAKVNQRVKLPGQ